MWVHCPRASNGLFPRRSNLVGYVRWDAQSDQFPPCQTIIPTAFRSQSELPIIHHRRDFRTQRNRRVLLSLGTLRVRLQATKSEYLSRPFILGSVAPYI